MTPDPNLPPQSATGFWSIERFVAFVLGPAVTAGAGWLSTFLAKKWGIHIDGPELAGIFATGALSASGLAYKWLHGRQVEMHATAAVAAAEAKLSVIPGASELIHTTAADLAGIAEQAAAEAVERVTGVKGGAPPEEADVGADPAPAGDAAAEAASGL